MSAADIAAGSAGGGGIELQASRTNFQAVGVGAVDLDRHDVGRADVDAVAAGVGVHQLIHGQVDMGRGVVCGLAVDDKVDVQIANLSASIGLVCGIDLQNVGAVDQEVLGDIDLLADLGPSLVW